MTISSQSYLILMFQKKEFLVSMVAIILASSALFYLEPGQLSSNNLSKQGVQCQNRFAIMIRAQRWVDLHVSYSQQGSFEGWRTDCSGYVSMAWNLDWTKPGLTTYTMHTVAHNISQGELINGDALNCDSRHIVLFGGWTDSTKTHYFSLEQANENVGTIKSVTPYPYWNNDWCFHPIRYNNAC